MKDAFIDVSCELNPVQLAQERDPARFVLELSRETADARCAESGARLRTDRAPEVVVSHAIEPTTGRDVILVASRWAVLVPDSLEV